MPWTLWSRSGLSGNAQVLCSGYGQWKKSRPKITFHRILQHEYWLRSCTVQVPYPHPPHLMKLFGSLFVKMSHRGTGKLLPLVLLLSPVFLPLSSPLFPSVFFPFWHQCTVLHEWGFHLYAYSWWNLFAATFCLCTCMCVHACVCTCVHVCLHLSVSVCVCIHINTPLPFLFV